MPRREAHDRGIGRVRITGGDPHAAHRYVAQVLEGGVWLGEIGEPVDALAPLVGGPERARPEGVQVLMEVDLAQRVGTIVAVGQPGDARQHSRRFVERGADGVLDVLLPVARGVGGAFERVYDASLSGYTRSLRWAMQHRGAVMIGSLVLFAGTILLFQIVPKGFIPNDDLSLIRGTTEAAEGTSFDEMAFLNSVVDAPGGEGPRAGSNLVAEDKGEPRPPIPRRSAGPGRGGNAGIQNPASSAGTSILGKPSNDAHPMAENVSGNHPIVLREKPSESVKTLKCADCASMNYPTEWYCEKCGAELASL